VVCPVGPVPSNDMLSMDTWRHGAGTMTSPHLAHYASGGGSDHCPVQVRGRVDGLVSEAIHTPVRMLRPRAQLSAQA
jgi:hypothetical protein